MATNTFNSSSFGTLDTSAFEQAAFQLSRHYEQVKELELQESQAINEPTEVGNKLKALQGALQALSGIKVINVAADENREGFMIITALVKQSHCTVTLNKEKVLTDIEISGKEMQWIDTSAIMKESLRFSPPNDLRHAFLCIGIVQEAKPLFQKHVSELRKRCLVDHSSTFLVKLGFRSGMSVVIEANHCYSQTLCGVTIRELAHTDDVKMPTDKIQSIKLAAEAKCFPLLSDLVEFIEAYDV